MKKYRFDLLIIFIIFHALVSCATENNSEIEIIDLSRNNFAIVNQKDLTILVYPRIQFYCESDEYILGWRIDAEGDNSDGSRPFTENLGYFRFNLLSLEATYDDSKSKNDLERECLSLNAEIIGDL